MFYYMGIRAYLEWVWARTLARRIFQLDNGYKFIARLFFALYCLIGQIKRKGQLSTPLLGCCQGHSMWDADLGSPTSRPRKVLKESTLVVHVVGRLSF